MKSFGLYTLTEEFYGKYQAKYSLSYNKGGRPVCCFIKDNTYSDLYYVIPMHSVRVGEEEKDGAIREMNRVIQRRRKCDTIYTAELVDGVISVFKIGFLHPVTSKYVEGEYKINNIAFEIKNTILQKDLSSRAKRIIELRKSALTKIKAENIGIEAMSFPQKTAYLMDKLQKELVLEL